MISLGWSENPYGTIRGVFLRVRKITLGLGLKNTLLKQELFYSSRRESSICVKWEAQALWFCFAVYFHKEESA